MNEAIIFRQANSFNLAPFANIPVILFIIAAAASACFAKKLTLAGSVTGVLVALAIFAGAGYTGLALLTAFFVLGTAATSWKKKEKQQIRSKQHESPSRTALQVLANGGVAAVIGALGWLFHYPVWLDCLLIAGSLSAATADTLSSELGMVYGRNFYNILTFRKDEKGLDGVISLEGTLLGTVGAVVIAKLYTIGFGWSVKTIIIIIAGVVGNLVDSVLGAWLERKGYINNDAVNFLNTLTGAIVISLLLKVI